MCRNGLIVFFLLVAFNAMGQRVYKPSIISKQQFLKHKTGRFVFERPVKNLKENGVIRIKKLVFKDDGEFEQYTDEGYLSGKPIIIIHKLEPNSEEYYLVNSNTLKIDTLISKPDFYSDDRSILCYRRAESDNPERIEVITLDDLNHLKKRVLKLTAKYYIESAYWYNKYTIYIQDSKERYYKISF